MDNMLTPMTTVVSDPDRKRHCSNDCMSDIDHIHKRPATAKSQGSSSPPSETISEKQPSGSIGTFANNNLDEEDLSFLTHRYALPNRVTSEPVSACSPSSSSTLTSHQDPSPTEKQELSKNEAKSPSDIQTVSLRCLLTVKEAGAVIGKAGRTINDIRKKVAEAKFNISEQAPGMIERIVSITGPVDAVAKGYALIATAFVQESISTQNNENKSSPNHVSLEEALQKNYANIKLIVPQSKVGKIIGKQGAKLMEIQEASAAKLIVDNELLLQSTEKTVTVYGVVDAIHIAVFHIATILADIKNKDMIGNIPYMPRMQTENGTRSVFMPSKNMTAHPTMVPLSPGSVARPRRAPRGISNLPPHPAMMFPLANGHNPGVIPSNFPPGVMPLPQRSPIAIPYTPMIPVFDGVLGGTTAPMMHGLTPNNLETASSLSLPSTSQAQKSSHGSQIDPSSLARGENDTRNSVDGKRVVTLEIPQTLAGLVIGAKGSKISQIRHMTRCIVKIHPLEEGAQTRVMTLTGTNDAILRAEQMVCAFIGHPVRRIE